MTVICAREKAAAVQKAIEADAHRAWVIGEVIKGSGIVRLN
jgi:phosphoribosylaminoimidazole (AIR) synthetase